MLWNTRTKLTCGLLVVQEVCMSRETSHRMYISYLKLLIKPMKVLMA